MKAVVWQKVGRRTAVDGQGVRAVRCPQRRVAGDRRRCTSDASGAAAGAGRTEPQGPSPPLLGYAVVLAVGSVLAAAAQNAGMFIGGHVLQGLATSMLLIAAAPPLTIGFPRDKLRNTAVIMNMCVFGAVALGPFIGGAQAEAHAWRPLFWIVAGIAVLALIMAALTFEDAPPADLDAPRDLKAIALAAVGCTAAFVGAAQLTTHSLSDLAASAPMFGGLVLIVGLIVYQFRTRRPLLIVRTMLTSAIPVAGSGRRLVRGSGVGGGHRADSECVDADVRQAVRKPYVDEYSDTAA
jgi:hypothetical protein